MTTLKRSLLGTALVLPALMPFELNAQALEEIVVTAERREAGLQTVSAAVSAFDGPSLDRLQINEPLDLIEYVPNLVGSNNVGIGTANVYFLRGLGSVAGEATFDPPVGTYVNEIYLARQFGNNVSFFDIERIEVLRGPQGTLFGRNTTGGAVSIFMAKPAEEFGGFIEGRYGSYNRKVFRGSVDVPVTDRIFTKFSGFWVDDNGFVDNVTTGEKLNGQESFGARFDLRVEASESVTWDMSFEYSEDQSLNSLNYNPDTGPTVESTDGNRIARTGLRSGNTLGPGATPLDLILAGQGLGLTNETIAVHSDVTVEVSNGAFNFITGYRFLQQDYIQDFFDGGLGGQGFATGGFTIGNLGDHEQFSQEVKYAGSFWEDRIDLVAGLFYFYEDNTTDFVDVFTLDIAPGGFPLVLADRILTNTLDAIAVYSQVDFNVTDRLTLTAGARYTKEDKKFSLFDKRDDVDPEARLDTGNIIREGIPDELITALITPKFAIEYQWTDDIMTYASFTQGFKSGGWNVRGTVPETFQPFDREKADSYEIGLRSEFFQNRLRVNATAFYMEVSEYQIPSAFEGSDGTITFITLNDAGLENLGLELELQATPIEGLNVFVNAGLQDAEYIDLAQSIVDQQAQCRIDGTGAAQGIVGPDCEITTPVRTPDLTLTMGGSYDIPVEFIGGYVQPSINARYQSEQLVGTSGLPQAFTDGVWIVNAGISLVSEEAGWELRADCTNCFDNVYAQSNLGPTIYINEPSRFMVSARYNF